MNKINKSKISTIALILLLTISATLIALPSVAAQSSKPTFPFIGATPNPTGTGQAVLLHVGITDPTPSVDYSWEGLTVTVTDPSGHEETIGPLSTDSTGGTGAVYTPSMVGTYYLVTNFPEQVMPEVGTRWVTGGTIMEASTSETLELVVNEDPIEYYPAASLPTEYWSRPIDAQLWEWTSIAGNWLAIPANRYAPYNDGPETSHILWSTPLTTGGLVGGELGDHSYECGDAYEGEFGDSIIINGVLYYHRYSTGFSGGPAQQGVIAIDLHTGEQLWFKNNTRLAFGQNFYWDSYNYHGTFDYLWVTSGTTWYAYDAFTAELEYTMTDVPSGERIYGPKGEIYIYSLDLEAGWMSLWNSSRVVSDHGSWRTYLGGGVFDARDGIEWNKTIPTGLAGSVQVALEDRILGSDIPSWTGLADNPITFWALSTEPGEEGTLLWTETWQPPEGRLTMLWGTASVDDGIFVITAKELRQLCVFDIDSGDYLWTTEPAPYLDIYSLGEERAISRAVVVADGKLFTVGMAGVVYCYDVATTDLLWTYDTDDTYSEILWSNSWPMNIAFITDGKIYMVHDEHSPIDPKPRGSPFLCLDVENGDVVWRIDGAFRGTQWGGTAVIGDSIIALYNSYDQQVYALGKGASSTTVSVKNDVVNLGSSVMVTGTVMDVSPGTDDAALAIRFPNGVAAVSDDSMNDWMKYVYMQFERPANAVGVTVKLEAIDPNGNYQNLGTTTSDSYGNYGFAFKPELEGTYMVIATFEGSKAYYGSTETTYVQVDAASASTPIEPDTETPDTETPDTETPDTETPDTETPDTETPTAEAPLISTEVAIIAVVAVACVIGVAAFWALRKRK